MQTIGVLLFRLISIMCVAGAFWLCFSGIKGWGWFLFMALLTSGATLLRIR
jgi:hypothetical protein